MIIILLTPFHFHQFKLCKEQFGWDVHGALVLYARIMDRFDLEAYFEPYTDKVIPVPSFKFSLPELLRSPIEQTIKQRKSLKRLEYFIDDLPKTKDSFHTLIIGTDKDMFTQLFFERMNVRSEAVEVHLMDEGAGMYKSESFIDQVWKLVYGLFSWVLFGRRLRYIGTLGMHPYLDHIYIRFKDFLPYLRDDVVYHEIRRDERAMKKDFESSREILLLTSPLSIDGHCHLATEKEILQTLFKVLNDHCGFGVVIKPHPRDSVAQLEQYTGERNRLMNSRITAEEIDYFNYRYVLHFGSSVIFDLWQKGYPMSRVITLDMGYAQNELMEFLKAKGKSSSLFVENLEEELKGMLDESY